MDKGRLRNTHSHAHASCFTNILRYSQVQFRCFLALPHLVVHSARTIQHLPNPPRHTMNASELQRLVDASWGADSDARRELYATEFIPGFPWFFERTDQSGESDGFSVASKNEGEVRCHVVPYFFQFTVFAKGRWVGRKLIDVYTEELTHHDRSYYERMIQLGHLRIQRRRKSIRGEKHARGESSTGDTSERESNRHLSRVEMRKAARKEAIENKLDAACEPQDTMPLSSPEDIIGDGDVVIHTVHRHEIPLPLSVRRHADAGNSADVVLDLVELVSVRSAAELNPKRSGGSCTYDEDADGLLLTVSKPSGIPTHPSGRYNMNTVTEMLGYVLAPRRIRAWLVEGDPLLQAIVSTAQLSENEMQRLLRHYNGDQPSFSSNSATGFRVEERLVPRPCHRLDKVTSGLLLMATTNAATSKISTLLQSKSKQMDMLSVELVQNLIRLHTSERESSPIDAQSLSGKEEHSVLSRSALNDHVRHAFNAVNFDVQKEYVACVHGFFAQHTMQRTANQSGPSSTLLSASEMIESAVHGVHVLRVRDLPASTQRMICLAPDMRLRENASSTRTDPDDLGESDECILIMSPVSRVAYSATGGDEGATSKGAESAPKGALNVEDSLSRENEASERNSNRQWMRQSAVTLARRLRYDAARNQSIVSCFPLTGRTHQLRIHLSDWGHSIVGDTAYDSVRGEAPYASVIRASGESNCSAAAATHGSAVRIGPKGIVKELHESNNVGLQLSSVGTKDAPRSQAKFFDAAVLPDNFRERFFSSHRTLPSRERERSTAFADHDDANLFLCSECTGILPITPTDDHEGCRIELHARRYSVRVGDANNKSSKCEQGGGGGRGAANALKNEDAEPCSPAHADEGSQMRDSSADTGTWMDFSVPLPWWTE